MSDPSPVLAPVPASEKGDAICFTAGPKGAIFGLGVIHAYLTTDQPPPVIVAGVSCGALTAAAFQRCYRELEEARKNHPGNRHEIETARWRWYRRYLSAAIERPLEVLWKVVPDLSDLIANRPPIRETALPQTPDGKDDPKWIKKSQQSRLEYYMIAKLVRWLGHVRVSVKDLALAFVFYVRSKEDFPDRTLPQPVAKLLASAALAAHVAKMILSISASVTFYPEFYRRNLYKDFLPKASMIPSPLFGWTSYLLLGPVLLFGLLALAAGALGLLGFLWESSVWILVFFLLALGGAAVVILIATMMAPSRLPDRLLGCVNLRDSLVNDFYLELKLHQLFLNADGSEAIIEDQPVTALFAATPLDCFGTSTPPEQLYARPQSVTGQDYPLVQALKACLAIPPLLRPVTVEGDDRFTWLKRDSEYPPKSLHLVDSAPVCPNPLPVLLDQLKAWQKSGDPRVNKLTAEHASDYRVHLVHGTRLERPERHVDEREDLSVDGRMAELPNCVDAALNGLTLSQRRDSRTETWQTNYQSELSIGLTEILGDLPERNGRKLTLPILVDEVAPQEDLRIVNPLDPEESAMLRHAAAGCRATLQVLYRRELGALAIAAECPSFLATTFKGKENHRIQGPAPSPGTSEICQHCTKKLNLVPLDRVLSTGRPYTQAVFRRFLPKDFRSQPQKVIPATLCRGLEGKPRIVFLASGGVFRGAFHIGMLAAMWKIEIKPDLIVGASVGTLMGAMLGQLFQPGKEDPRKILGDLVETFLNVDKTVGLTRQFKSALRDLSTRARTINLSTDDVRRLVFRGASGDPTFASTGAPAEIIDAISRLFLIPNEATRKIAADFVSEDVTRAVTAFTRALRDETVVRLGVKNALLGTELLEREIKEMFRAIPADSKAQPFRDSNIGFLATTVNLNTELMEILGVRVPEQELSYDFIQAALGSSAFPLAFRPRRESEIYPGSGRRDVFFGDGGMYDNLPFFPAILVLGAAQHSVLEDLPAADRLAALQNRFERPDLFIVGALDADPEHYESDYHRSLFSITSRATSLAKNKKTKRFERLNHRVDLSLRRTVAEAKVNGGAFPEYLDTYVHAGVLTAIPASNEHLNQTFAFCASLGLKQDRVRRSIGDGCHQLLRKIVEKQSSSEDADELARALRVLKFRVTKRCATSVGRNECPHFLKNDEPIECPFVSAGQERVYRICSTQSH